MFIHPPFIINNEGEYLEHENKVSNFGLGSVVLSKDKIKLGDNDYMLFNSAEYIQAVEYFNKTLQKFVEKPAGKI